MAVSEATPTIPPPLVGKSDVTEKSVAVAPSASPQTSPAPPKGAAQAVPQTSRLAATERARTIPPRPIRKPDITEKAVAPSSHVELERKPAAAAPVTTAVPPVANTAALAPQGAAPAGCDTAVHDIAAAGPLQFHRNAAGLDRSKRTILDKLAGVAAACPKLRLQISGHADARGNTKRNQSLSERRARVVVGYLITKGIDAGRLKAVGYGDTRPLASNDDAQNRAKNRRIEFEVTGLQSTGSSGE